MRVILRIIFVSYLLLGTTVQLYASDEAPWGVAGVLDIEYEPQRVLYELTTGDKNKLSRVLDRIVYLYKLYQSDPLGSSIVVVIHGDAILYFAIDVVLKNEKIYEACSEFDGRNINRIPYVPRCCKVAEL